MDKLKLRENVNDFFWVNNDRRHNVKINKICFHCVINRRLHIDLLTLFKWDCWYGFDWQKIGKSLIFAVCHQLKNGQTIELIIAKKMIKLIIATNQYYKVIK